jgi:hypothetical protein
MNKPAFAAVLAAAGLALCACSGGSGGSAHPASSVTVTTSPSASQSSSAPAQPATAQPSQSASTGAATPAGCLTRYLAGSIGLTQGTAGSVDVAIVFKNLDNVPCTLYGFPGVAQAAGTPVTDIGQPSVENPTSTRILVTLPPGGYANATLQITDAGNYPTGSCDPVPATWLAVIPPNQTVPLYIHYDSTACKNTGVKLLTVETVQAGNSGMP